MEQNYVKNNYLKEKSYSMENSGSVSSNISFEAINFDGTFLLISLNWLYCQKINSFFSFKKITQKIDLSDMRRRRVVWR